jgi:hypothetical protein
MKNSRSWKQPRVVIYLERLWYGAGDNVWNMQQVELQAISLI